MQLHVRLSTDMPAAGEILLWFSSLTQVPLSDKGVCARSFTYYLTLNRLQQGDAVLWAALLRGSPGRTAQLLYFLYGTADAPANLEVNEADSSFTLRQHLLTPEQVAAVRARPAAGGLRRLCLIAQQRTQAACLSAPQIKTFLKSTYVQAFLVGG